MMEISKLSYIELLSLKRKVDAELLFKKESRAGLKDILNIYAIGMIEFVNSEIGIDVTQKNRKNVYTFSRFVIMKHLHEKGMLLSDIGRVLNLDHTSVIHGINTYNQLLSTEFERFMTVAGKINNLINNFNDKEKAKADTRNIQVKRGEVA